jgi:hypothetical protein
MLPRQVLAPHTGYNIVRLLASRSHPKFELVYPNGSFSTTIHKPSTSYTHMYDAYDRHSALHHHVDNLSTHHMFCLLFTAAAFLEQTGCRDPPYVVFSLETNVADGAHVCFIASQHRCWIVSANKMSQAVPGSPGCACGGAARRRI